MCSSASVASTAASPAQACSVCSKLPCFSALPPFHMLRLENDIFDFRLAEKGESMAAYKAQDTGARPLHTLHQLQAVVGDLGCS